ncbi:MAG TPA: PQQ-binding-like beta-propeller repeat protein [Candidatus Krumholzibacteria bacterium]|nr:PQQ-binding-like beta-propeller repeat protein [Candidatus Krumholzibacteria bacterium]
MTRSTLFMPAVESPGGGLCYAERARAGRGLFMVLQDLSPRTAGSRNSFLRAAYRGIVARYQSAATPETAPALLRNVVLVLDATARQVETRVDDFRGLGILVLVLDGRSAFLLCGRDVPARIRTGGVLLPAAAGVAGAVEVSIETSRAQQDLFAQSLTDSLALYRFDLASTPHGAGLEFFLGGGAEDAAAVLDALEVARGVHGRVTLERSSLAVLHVVCDVAEGFAPRERLDRAPARARRSISRRAAIPVAGAIVLAAAFVGLRGVGGDGSVETAGQLVQAPRERPQLQDVRNEPPAGAEVAAVARDEATPSRARGFAEAWQRTYRDAVTSSPVALGRAVVFGGRDGNVYALDPDNGEALWTHRADGGVGASPVVVGDAVIACDYAGSVTRLGRADGRVAWKRDLKEKIVSTPAVTSERVVVGTVGGNVSALSRDSGRVLWKFRTRGQIRGALAASGGTVFVPSHDGRLYALTETTGARRWAAPLGGPVSSSPAVEDGRVFVGTAKGSVIALDAASGGKLWSFSTRGAVNAPPLAAGGRVYAGSTDRSLYCLDATTGALVWKHATSGVILSRPEIDGDRVVVTSYDGAVYCLDAATGDLRGRFDTSQAIFSSPLVRGDLVYFGNNDGRFYALELPR